MPVVGILILSLLNIDGCVHSWRVLGQPGDGQVAYILSIGLDRGKRKVSVTISIANPQNIAGAGAGGGSRWQRR